MTEKESKKGLGLLIAALAGIAGVALLTRRAGAAGEALGADIRISVLGAEAGALAANTTYTATVKVTNKSTRLNVYVPATLTVKILAKLANVDIGTSLRQTDVYLANTELTIPSTGYNFTIPTDGGGKTGSVDVSVLDPAGTVIKIASLAITVEATAEIIYAADVIISV